jgi:16S rRNA (uracil1498-N3)-methyltransferase
MRGLSGLCMLLACYVTSALLALPTATVAKYDHRWPRLFIDKPLSAGAALPLDDAQLRYLSTVLRLKNGAAVRIFDGRSGEYKAILSGLPERKSKRTTTVAVLQIGEVIRAQTEDYSSMNVWLLCAPIRKQRMKLLIEKATELGAARIVPVVTAFTQESLDAEGVNRLTDVAVEVSCTKQESSITTHLKM